MQKKKKISQLWLAILLVHSLGALLVLHASTYSLFLVLLSFFLFHLSKALFMQHFLVPNTPSVVTTNPSLSTCFVNTPPTPSFSVTGTHTHSQREPILNLTLHSHQSFAQLNPHYSMNEVGGWFSLSLSLSLLHCFSVFLWLATHN